MDDRAFIALADEDRRQLLGMLAARDRDPPVRVPDDLLSRTTDPTAMGTRLHHVHLPKLASMEYVEWDPESGVVRRGPSFEELEPLLAVLDEHEMQASD